MKLFFFQILTLIVIGCEPNTNKAPEQIDLKKSDAEIAVRFLNDYVIYCDNRNSNKNLFQWIDDNTLLTTKFKVTHKKIIEDAEKTDPELGLGFDPIFDAQDYPSGFVVKSIDNTGFVTLEGEDWQDFVVTVKLVYIDSKWFVDGAGIINISKDKQARRKKMHSAHNRSYAIVAPLGC